MNIKGHMMMGDNTPEPNISTFTIPFSDVNYSTSVTYVVALSTRSNDNGSGRTQLHPIRWHLRALPTFRYFDKHFFECRYRWLCEKCLFAKHKSHFTTIITIIILHWDRVTRVAAIELISCVSLTHD